VDNVALLYLDIIDFVQALTVLSLSPLLVGIINRIKAVLESRHGPPLLQPYFDLYKLFSKKVVVPSKRTLVYTVYPFIAISCYTLISMVVPIITPYPLGFAPTVDFLGGAFLFTLAGSMSIFAALDSGDSAISTMGASRSAIFTAFSEPILIMIFVAVALISGTNNPYITQQDIMKNPVLYLYLVHVFAIVSFFMLLLVETGKIPIESSGLMELGMIDEAKNFEYSSKNLALIEWGAYMKQFILFSVFINVFILLWGLSSQIGYTLIESIVVQFAKLVAISLIFITVEVSMAKIRLFKILDFLAISLALAVLSVIMVIYTVVV